jgi:hypothetical protein
LVMSPGGLPPRNSRIDYIEALLRCLREAGFSAGLAYHAYHAIDSHILGFTLWELGHNVPSEGLDDLVAEFLGEMGAGEFPYLIEHAGQHLNGLDPDDSQNEFEFGLDLIIEGLKRRMKIRRA